MSNLSYIYKILEDLEDQKKPDESNHIAMGLRWISPEFNKDDRSNYPEVYVDTFKGPADAFRKVGTAIMRDKQGPKYYNKNQKNLKKRYGLLDDLIISLEQNWKDIQDVYFELIDDAEMGKTIVDHDHNTGITLIFAPSDQLNRIKDMLYSSYHTDIDFKKHPYRDFR